MSELQRVMADAMRLPKDERVQLVATLVDSLEAPESDSESDVLAEWVTEAKRRLADRQAGKLAGVPYSEVQRRAREMIERAKRRASAG